MKRFLIILCSAFLAVSLLEVAAADANKPAKPVKRGPLVHMVAFKFKADATPEQIKKVETTFAALPEKIAEIRSLEWGTNISPEKLDKGFTHGFVLTFDNAKDRDTYLVHPDHKAFGGIVGPVLADVFVLDFDGAK